MSLTQPWGNNPDSYLNALVWAIALKKDFENLLMKAAPNESKVLIDIKSYDSFVKKLQRKSDNEIHDVLRGAIITKTKNDMDTAVKNIHWLSPIKEIDYKNSPDEKTGYCGSIHTKISLKGMICEIQIMTEALWSAKELLHPYYERVKTSEIDPSIKRFGEVVYDTAKKSSL